MPLPPSVSLNCPSEEHYIGKNDPVTVQCTCVTSQYQILDWHSHEVIGPGGTAIEFHVSMTEAEVEEPKEG